MTKEQLQYGTTNIKYTLEYADRKTMGIKVHPDKSVQVIAPLEAQKEEIQKKLKSKAAWILKQQDFFLSFEPRTPVRQYVSGETHLYLGKQYRLKIIQASEESVKMQGGNINVYLAEKSDTLRVKQLLNKWYKEKAKIHFTQLFEDNRKIAKNFHKSDPELKFRWFKKRWGSCTKEGIIYLNLELIKAPKSCINYVIIHELCHLVHLNHSIAFYKLLSKYCSDWKELKNQLEKLMV